MRQMGENDAMGQEPTSPVGGNACAGCALAGDSGELPKRSPPRHDCVRFGNAGRLSGTDGVVSSTPLTWINAPLPPLTKTGKENFPRCRGTTKMKVVLEILGESCAAAAAVLWFVSARIRLKEGKAAKQGLDINDPKRLMLLVYEQSRWSAWAAIAAGIAALFALADGLLPGT